jgi:hypothetical protein
MQTISKITKLATVAAAVASMSMSAQATINFGTDYPVDTGTVVAVFSASNVSAGANSGGYPVSPLPQPINNYNNLATAIGLVNSVVNPDFLTTDGQLGGPTPANVGNQFSVGSGWEYLLVRYDGNQGGIVILKLGGEDALVPFYSYDIFNSYSGGKNPTPSTTSYGVSHYVLVGTHTTNVPEGGATVALLGIGSLALAAARRRIA